MNSSDTPAPHSSRPLLRQQDSYLEGELISINSSSILGTLIIAVLALFIGIALSGGEPKDRLAQSLVLAKSTFTEAYDYVRERIGRFLARGASCDAEFLLCILVDEHGREQVQDAYDLSLWRLQEVRGPLLSPVRALAGPAQGRC